MSTRSAAPGARGAGAGGMVHGGTVRDGMFRGGTAHGGTVHRQEHATQAGECEKVQPPEDRDARNRAALDRAASDRASVRLTLREALPSDLVPLTFFCDAMLRRDYFIRRGQLAEMIRSERHKVLVAEIDIVLVGMAILTRGSRLVNVLVHPAYRGLGIGRALVEASGATEVRVKRDMSAGDPTPFYRSLGFEAAATPRPDERIVLMTKRSARVSRQGSAAVSEVESAGVSLARAGSAGDSPA